MLIPAADSRAKPAHVKQIRVFLADFGDAPHPSAYTTGYFRDLFFGLGVPRKTPEGDPLGGSVREFFLNVSGGRLDVAGEVSGWVRLPGKIAKVPHWKGGMEPFGESWPIVIAETLRANGIIGKDAEGKLRLPDGSMPDGLVFLNTDFGMGGVRREWGDLKDVLAKMGRAELWDSAWEGLGMPLGSFSVTHWPGAPGTDAAGTLPVEIPPAEQRFFPLSVMMHEMGHLLADLPDLYGGAFEPWGVFDLMGGPAAWTHFPMTFGAYLRESKGWMSYRTLPMADHRGLALHPLETHAEALRLPMGPDADSEAMVLENRWRLEYPPGMAGPPANRGARLIAYRLDPAGRRRQAYGDDAIGKVTALIRRPEHYGEVWGEPGHTEITGETAPTSRNSLGELWWELTGITPDEEGTVTLDARLRALDLVRGYTGATWRRGDGEPFPPGDPYEAGGGAGIGAPGPSDSDGPTLRVVFSSPRGGKVEATWKPSGEGPWRLYLTARRADAGREGAVLSVRSGGKVLAREPLPEDGSAVKIGVDVTGPASDLTLSIEGRGPVEARISDAWLVGLPGTEVDFLSRRADSPGLEPVSRAVLGDGRAYGPRVLLAPVGGERKEWDARWAFRAPAGGGVLRALLGLLKDAGDRGAVVEARLRVGEKTLPLIKNVRLSGGEAPAALELPLAEEAKGREAVLEIHAHSDSEKPLRIGIPTLMLCDS
jgi:hypothetical protein